MPPALALVAILLYGRTLGFEFTNWDDQSYILSNPYLHSFSVDNIKALLTPGSVRGELLYIPVTYLTHFAESLTLGLHPWVLHGTNTVLHAVNGVLVFFVVQGWSRCRVTAFLVALAFIVHPLQTESVAWAMGRKELLSTAFALATLLLYRRARNHEDRRCYLLAVVTFALGTLAKPTIIVLPLLLLLEMLREPRRGARPHLLWLIPLAIIAIAVYWLNSLVGADGRMSLFQAVYLPAVLNDWLLRLGLVSAPSPLYALDTTLNPNRLVVWQLLPALSLAAIIALAVRHRWRGLWFGAGFGAIAVIPAMTVVLAVDRQFITADRYGYFPLVGVFFTIIAVRHVLPGKWRGSYTVLLAVALLLCTWRSWQQTAIWRQSEALWQHVLAGDPGVYQAYNSLGNYYQDNDRLDEALTAYQQAIELRPDVARPWLNQAILLERLGRPAGAAQACRRAIRLQPGAIDARLNLAGLYQRQKACDQAIAEFAAVLAIDPRHTGAMYYTGVCWQALGDPQQALAAFEKLVAADPGNAEAHFKVGLLLHQGGDLQAAIESYHRALFCDPAHEEARDNLGVAEAARKER
jgi:Flp pilus assembly protein TadD